MSYGPDLDLLARRSATHVDKILGRIESLSSLTEISGINACLAEPGLGSNRVNNNPPWIDGENNMTRFLLFASMMLGTTVLADDYYEQQARLKALDQRCEQARQKVLRPVREKLIEKCVGTERRGLQDCQLEFNEYGESTTGARGNVIRGLYYDIPECTEAKRAWDAWESSQPMRR